MHVIKPNLRLVALAAAIIAAVLLGSSLAPGSGGDDTFANTPAALIGTSCSDIYLDIPPVSVKGTGPGAEDLAFPANPLAKSITRTEPSKVNPGGVQVTTVTYLGPNLDDDPIGVPDAPPTTLQCDAKITAGKLGPEANTMHPETKFQIIGNKRPTSEGIIVEKPGIAEGGAACAAGENTDSDSDLYINDGCPVQPPAGAAETGLQCINHVDDDADGGFVNDGCPIDGSANGAPVAGTYLRFSGCAFSEASKEWIRTDVNSRVEDKTAQSQNYGYVTLYLGTSSPIFDNQGNPDPLTCNAVGSTPFPSVIDARARQASTDDAAQVTVDVVTDPDGVPMPGKQPIDGDTIPDDWDGDGCTDWDELAPKFKDDQSGRDPFNPNDCQTAATNDLTGTYNVLATAFPAAKQGRIIGPKTDVTSVGTKVIKDGKHIEADVNVVNPGALKQNQKLYWDTTDTLQVGYWQVTDNPSAGNPIHLERLVVPPCGLITTGIPGVADPAPGQLMGVACDGPVQSGNYFHCIARIDHDTGTDLLDSNLVCYIDSPGLAVASPIKSGADGNAGPPPPPPYLTGGPSKVTGTYNPVTNQISLTGCFENAGPPLGPNIMVQAHVDAKTGKGFTRIFGQQGSAACVAGTPVILAGPPPAPTTSVLQVETVLTRQNLDFDHDADGCSDYNELGHDGKVPPPPKDCGDDPYNPLDSDMNFNSSSTISVTVQEADVDTTPAEAGGQCGDNLDNDTAASIDYYVNDGCPAGGANGTPETGAQCENNTEDDGDAAGFINDGCPAKEILPGSYFHCVADQQHNVAGKTLTTRLMCYTDNPLTTVNCQEAGAGAASPCATRNLCQPLGDAHKSRCGDGLAGVTPPANSPAALKPPPTGTVGGKAGAGNSFGDVDGMHTQLSGTVDNDLNTLNISGCFDNLDNVTQQPAIYTRAVINAHTGAGTVDIFLNQPATCTPLPGGEPAAPYNDVPIETAEQATKNAVPAKNQLDTDHDHCADKLELRNRPGAGTSGLRDPYNPWDFISVPTGSALLIDNAVGAGDIAAVVARFGAADNSPAGTFLSGDFNRNSERNSLPNAAILPSGNRANYHPAFDRGGGLTGANAWNLRGPDGAIGAGELAALVGQFGNNCASQT